MARLLWNALIIALLLVLLLAAVSCSNTPTPKPTSPPGYFTYIDNVNGFSIAYPGGWMNSPLLPPFDRMALVSVGPSASCGGFDAGFYLYTDRLRLSQTLDAYSEYNLDYVRRSYREFSELGKQTTEISSLTAIKVEYEYRLSDYTKVREMTIYVGQGSTVWNLDFIAAASCWDQYVTTVDTIVNSFKISQ
jgi:hypothetical protein